MTTLIITFLILLGLELVLGIDNIIMVGIISHRCPPKDREKARKIGILLATGGRLALLSGVSFLLTLTTPIATVLAHTFSWKDIILLAGGAFLLYKAAKEIHHTVSPETEETSKGNPLATSFPMAIAQIWALDLVFSIDSVITAVGLSNSLPVMFAAVIASAICILAVSKPIIDFIHKNPSVKVLALAFLIVIGVVICLEAFGQHIPKSYIYLPLGFCIGVEFLQMRLRKNKNHNQ